MISSIRCGPVERHSPSDQSVDLDGVWRAHLHEADLVKSFVEDGFFDGGWPTVTVPHHWRTEPAFARTDGPLLYRHRFAAPAPGD